MTAWRTPIIRQAENTADDRHRTTGGASQPETATIHDRPAAAETPRPRLFSAVKIKELFGKLAEAVTGKPTPSLAAKRKRRREETGGLFKRLAIKLLTIVARVKFPEPDPWYMPPAELDNTQRLLLRQRTAQDAYGPHQQHYQTFHSHPPSYLSPRL